MYYDSATRRWSQSEQRRIDRHVVVHHLTMEAGLRAGMLPALATWTTQAERRSLLPQYHSL